MTCLPATVWDFTGRAGILGQVRQLLGAGDSHSRPVVVITGPAGVGKTSLALRAAHQAADTFSGGRVFVAARDTEGEPVPAGQLVSRALIALGVDGSTIPADEPSRYALYQRLLSRRRVLLVFDDVADPAQVRPLFPGDPGSAALLTSRLALPGLEAARPVRLGVFTPAEALEFLVRLVGPERVAAEQPAAAEIARACGLLPLAIRIAGARLAARPHWTLADMTARLADERRRLDELTADDLGVRACLAVSYRQLDGPSQRAFRLLGVLDMPEIPAWAAAAALELPEIEARDQLDTLTMTGLLEPGTAGDRFRFHDLVRLYARETAAAADGDAGAAAVIERTLTRCARLAEAASQLLPGGFRSQPGEPAAAAAPPDDLARSPQAWLAQEEAGLVATHAQGCKTGAIRSAVRLSVALEAFFELGTRYDSWRQVASALEGAAATNATARAFAGYMRGALASDLGQPQLAVDLLTAAAAQLGELGEDRCRAYADTSLGINHAGLRDLASAIPAARRALRAFEALGEQQGIAYARMVLSLALGNSRSDAEAIVEADLAIENFRRVGHAQGEVEAVRIRARVLAHLGRHREAAESVLDALGRLGPVLPPVDVAILKLGLADELAKQDLLDDALRWATEAAAGLSEAGNRFLEARACHCIAAIELAQGRYHSAITRLEYAARAYEELGTVFYQTRARDDLSKARLAVAASAPAGP